MCVGSMTSARSALTLLGATVIGRWSDSKALLQYGGGRKLGLWMGVSATGVSIIIANGAASSLDLWLASVVPVAFQQNLCISQALLGEYQESIPGGVTPSERASSAGLLGMSAGLAMMIGPLLGAVLVETPDQATKAAMLLLLAAASLICLLPEVYKERSDKLKVLHNHAMLSFLDVPSARSPAARFLLTCRMLSTLGFQIFQTMWTVHMKERLGFGPQDYGRLLSFSGLVLCLSQGFLAKLLLNWCGGNARGRVRLLAICTATITLLRFLTFQTVNVASLYIIISLSITACGISSTIFSADTSQVASPDELGGFFGLQVAGENMARMAGPLVGGALSSIHPTIAPLAVVVTLNVTILWMVLVGYDRIVLKQREKKRC
jgi:hypothetical protein